MNTKMHATSEALDSGYGNPWQRRLVEEAADRKSRNWVIGTALVAALLAALAILFLGCSNGGDSPTSPSMGMLAVEMKDAPIQEVAEIDVYVVGLTVKPVDGPVETIASDIGLIDLLELQTRTELLATVNLEPGRYEYIRVDLDQDRSYVVELATGAQLPLQIASEEIKVQGGFEVFATDTTRLTLDFDAAQSLRLKGNGNWLLVPVIVQEEVAVE